MPVPERTVHELREAIRDVAQRGWLLDGERGTAGSGAHMAIGVTSPNQNEGKTTLSLGLASVLADELDGEVTLVDADFNTHSIGLEYALYGVSGLAEVLTGATAPREATHRVPSTKLAVVPAGNDLRGAHSRIRTQQAQHVMDEMKRSSSLLVIDLPAALHSAATPALASMCDAVIIVVRTGRTTVQDVEATVERLHAANLVGIVLNRWDTSIPGWVEKSLGLKR
jgi:MinD-like ATPase involved in chromosome partitioning or flagellar assembly